MKEKLLSLPKAAEICSVSRWTLWSYVKSGKLKALRTPGGHYRISENDLTEYLSKVNLPVDEESTSQKVLVVDDDPAVRKLLLRALSSEGFEVKTASDGFEAGQLSVKFNPQIIILDIVMPRMDGFEVCRLLKKNPETKNMKIIAISGFDTPENREKILECGADLFLAKPLDIERLRKEVEHILDSHHSQGVI